MQLLLKDTVDQKEFGDWSMAFVDTTGGADTMDGFVAYERDFSAAIGGAGVALGRSSMVDDDLDAGRLVKPFDLAVPVEFAFYVVYRKGSLEQQKVADFREWLFAEAAS